MARTLPRISLPLIAGLVLGVTGLAAQEPAVKAAPARLVVSAAPAARAVLDTALFEMVNASPLRAQPRLKRALALDTTCGFIRALNALLGASSPEARLREADRAVADAARGTPAEQLMVAAAREVIRGDQAAAATLNAKAYELVPDDPFVTAMLIQSRMGDAPGAVRVARAYADRNPDQAFVYNLLAYNLFSTGDTAGALAAAKHYVELLPNHPNPHDSYGDLLQQSGRLEEAEQEYRRVVQLDPDYVQGYWRLVGVADLRHDYKAAYAPLEALAARAGAPPSIRAMARLSFAFHALSLGDEERMRSELLVASAEAESAARGEFANDPELMEARSGAHVVLAVFDAARGRGGAARRELSAVTALWPAPMATWVAAMVHALVGTPAEVHADVTRLQELPQVAPWDVSFARLIEAAANGSVAGARSEVADIKPPPLAIMAQGYLAWGARRAGDAQALRAAQDEIAKYKGVDAFWAIAHLVATAK